jgi:multidrug resistance protein, MATE family
MSLFWKEARLTLALALPIVVGQVSQMLMGVTDSIMIGRLGAVPLAASAFAGGVFSVFYVIGIGLLLPVAVFVSREHGAGDDRAGARWLQHGVALAVVAGVVAMLAMIALAGGFDRMGQPPEVLAEIEPYYTLIVVSLLPVLVFQVFRQFAEALGRPWVPMSIMLASVALNVLLNWILIYGKFGAPALGLGGAGSATLASRIAALVAIVLWLRKAGAFRRVFPDTWIIGLQFTHIREMLRIGVPAAVMLFFEVGGFMVAAVMMGWPGATALAAHQIALSCAAFMFMFPLGLSMAVGMRIGKAVGEGRRDLLRPIAGGALAMSCAIMSVSAVGFALGGEWLARGFVNDAEVVGLASQLLVVAAIFQLFDGAQVIGRMCACRRSSPSSRIGCWRSPAATRSGCTQASGPSASGSASPPAWPSPPRFWPSASDYSPNEYGKCHLIGDTSHPSRLSLIK